MKVHVYGNTLNSALYLTRVLREKGVDAEMFLDNSSPNEQDYPWWDDKTMTRDNLPEWINYYPVFPNFLLPTGQTKKLIEDFSKCDIALVTCYGPMLAMRAKVPFVFHSLGSDLNMIDFSDDFRSLMFNTYSPWFKIRKLIKLFTYGRLQKWALRHHANKIILYAGYQYRTFIVKHGLDRKTIKLTYPMDVLNYGIPTDPEFNKQYEHYDLVFFMLARHSWKSVWNDPKGNDKFIRAFARFVKEKEPRAVLIMAKKGMDIDASKELVRDLGIENYVKWVDNMPKYELKKFQAMPNIVMVDNFWHDRWYDRYPLDRDNMRVCLGFGCVESLASKSLLMTTSTDQEYYDGESPPILNAFTEEEIYQRLLQVSAMSEEEKAEMRQAGYDFVVKWNEQTTIIDKHIRVLESVLAETKAGA